MAKVLLEHDSNKSQDVTAERTASTKGGGENEPSETIIENGQSEISAAPPISHVVSTELTLDVSDCNEAADSGNLKPSKSRVQRTKRSIESKQQQRAAEESQIFTFHPAVSDNSAKIAAKLGTDFWQRQKLHVEKQVERKAIEDAQAAYYSRRLSPQDKDTRWKNPGKARRSHARSVTMPSIFKSSSEENLISKKTEETPRSADVSESMPVINEKKRSSMQASPSKPCKSSLGGRIQSNGGNSDDDFSDADTKKSPRKKKIHYRSLTTEELDANHQRMMKAKEMATKAVKNKKVFLCCGPYQTIRGTLRHRGWVEKYFKPRRGGGRSRKQSNDSGDDSDDEIDQDTTIGSYEPTDEGTELTDSDSQYGIMSRVVRNCTPMMIWTLHRNDIDYKALRKDQFINHFGQAGTFTTKVGLCRNLRNSFIHGDQDCVHFYPRCYVLSSDEGREEFIDDYRLTTALSLLKLTIERHKDWYDASKKTGSLLRQESTKSTKDKDKPPTLSSKLIQQALRACYQHIDFMEHTDIEEDYHNKYYMTGVMWEMLIKGYSQVVYDGAIIPDATKMVSECINVMDRIKHYFPQSGIDGYNNMWIVKPGAKSRGRGISVMNNLDDMLALTSESTVKKENAWVIQKYIERPLLVYNTKFDIRQWFLVTDTNPLVFWFYKDCYIRFCGKEFSLTELDAQTHLANNSIQKHYEPGERCSELPDENMWDSDTFKSWLNKRGDSNAWSDLIYPQMKNAIKMSLLCCQDAIESRKNSFELYGADFMLSEDLKPWLIEINSSPALGASTHVTEKLCKAVIEDTFKVVIDRRSNKNCDIGRFELAYRQPNVGTPNYMGTNIALEGIAIPPPRTGTKASKLKPFEAPKVETTPSGTKIESLDSETTPKQITTSKSNPTRTVLKLEKNNKPDGSSKTTVASKNKTRSPVLRMTVRRNEERDDKIYRLDMPGQKSDTSLTEDEGKVPPIVRVNSRFVLGSKTCHVNAKEAKRESPRRSHNHTLSGSELGVTAPSKVALSLTPRSPTLGWPCRLSNFSMSDSASVPVVQSHQAVRFNGTVPFVVDSTRATAQAYRQRYTHAPPANKKSSRTELIGNYNKLYVNQIDLKPGHGVKQIQNVFL